MTVTTSTHHMNIGLSERDLRGVDNLLCRVLADEFVLYTKLRKYHWNVTGPMFFTLHELFEQHYTTVSTAIDNVAERSRALGQPATGTMAAYTSNTILREEPAHNPRATMMIASILDDHEAIIRALRHDIDMCEHEFSDAGTADFLTGLMEQHEEMAWMLRALLSETV